MVCRQGLELREERQDLDISRLAGLIGAAIAGQQFVSISAPGDLDMAIAVNMLLESAVDRAFGISGAHVSTP